MLETFHSLNTDLNSPVYYDNSTVTFHVHISWDTVAVVLHRFSWDFRPIFALS